jgi:hypothetical protein
MAGDAARIYRAFKAERDLVQSNEGGYRLASSWFRNTHGGVSVDDGALCGPEETWERSRPCGVAAILKSVILARGLELTMDPEDTKEDLARNPAHRVVFYTTAKHAKRLTESAEIVIRVEGWQVRGANGSVGELPPEEMPGPLGTLGVPPAKQVGEAEDSLTLNLFPDTQPAKK